MKVLSIFFGLFLLVSCGMKVPFTNEIRDEFGLETDKELRKVQFFTSETIILEKNKSTDNQSATEDGALVSSSRKTEERLIMPINTKCVFDGYGPNKFVRCVQSSKKIILFGKGEERRDHINVNDVASIVVTAAAKKINGIINAVSGSVISFYEIAKNIKIIYPKAKIKFKKRSGPVPHNGYRAFDSSLLRKKFSNVEPINLKRWLRNKDKYKIL